jgi:hypothetical protein
MHSEQQRKQWRAYNRRRREAARQVGTCTTCLSRPAEAGRASCRVCRQKRSKQ